ncbi:MAG: DUF3016 domain-containing protein [Rhodoferax sp.]
MKMSVPFLMAIATMASATHAGEVSVTWQEPGQYSDIRPGNESPDVFQARLFKEFDKTFSDLAKKLPDGYRLEITVTNLDLAGEANRMSSTTARDFRIIKQNDWPRMAFNYTLRDATSAVVVEGKEDLKDMNFMSQSGLLSDNTSFIYEKKMIKDWFRRQQKQKKFPVDEKQAKKPSR